MAACRSATIRNFCALICGARSIASSWCHVSPNRLNFLRAQMLEARPTRFSRPLRMAERPATGTGRASETQLGDVGDVRTELAEAAGSRQTQPLFLVRVDE